MNHGQPHLPQREGRTPRPQREVIKVRARRDTLTVLRSIENLIAECPNCQREFPLRRALLFYADKTLPAKAVEIKNEKERILLEREEDLRERRKRASVGAEATSVNVQLGFSLERIAPVLKGFGFHPRDCRALGDPIDYLVFEGLTECGVPERVCFVDIKTGEAGLNRNQRSIRDAIQAGNVSMETVSWPAKS